MSFKLKKNKSGNRIMGEELWREKKEMKSIERQVERGDDDVEKDNGVSVIMIISCTYRYGR